MSLEASEDASVALPSTSNKDDDDEVWKAYEEMVHIVKGKVKLNKKKSAETGFGPALDYLVSKERFLEAPSLVQTDSTTTASFEQAMMGQKEAFQQKTNLTDVQHDYAVKVLSYMADFCAKRQDPTPLQIAWRKLLEGGMVPRENCISTYMYALSLDERTMHLSGEAAAFHDLLFDPNEKTIALRIKSLIHSSSSDAVGAEQLLGSLPEPLMRLRTYLPILYHYCDGGDLSSALRLYRQMQQAPGVHLDADTYAVLIGAIAAQGAFRHDAEFRMPSFQQGPQLFDELAQEMADDILEINNSSARVLHNAFLRGFHDSLSATTHVLMDDEDMVEVNDPASPDEIILSRVSVDETTAVCPRSQAKLQLFQLEPSHRSHVHRTLLTMAKEQFKEFQQKLVDKKFNKKKVPKKQQEEEALDPDYPVRELQKFSTWLQEQQRDEPFTAVVDGANIGYFGHGTIRYSQIQHVVTELEAMKERPLVIMPHKYLQPKFYASMGKVQCLSEKDTAVIKRLEEEGKLYCVPPKCLDDYYWMIASIVGENADAQNSNKTVLSAANNDGRFPGIRPMLISNDQMRDHKLELIEPRLFRRWYSSHIVNFNFPNPYMNEWDKRPLEFYPADFFSREIQGNPSSITSDDDVAAEADESHGSLAWHFPVSEWGENERLCIRIR